MKIIGYVVLIPRWLLCVPVGEQQRPEADQHPVNRSQIGRTSTTMDLDCQASGVWRALSKVGRVPAGL
jgi:hypothetical protein